MQTRCPKCDTLFRVTDDQLNIADGIVRCGICEYIFNVNDDTDSLESGATDPSSEKPVVKEDDHQPDAYNFFEDKHDETVDYVVPREFRDSHNNKKSSLIPSVMWGIGTILLTLSLIIEYIWFNRNDYIREPGILAEVDNLCLEFDCTNLSFRAPSQIELVSRNIYSHPNEKQALMVNVTIKNNAAFSQPYPTMKIDFTDIRGNTIATRNFLPQEYLYALNLQQDGHENLLAPYTNRDITIEIVDPGIEALTYEFDFL